MSHTPDSTPPTARKEVGDLPGEASSNVDSSGSVFVGCRFTGSSFDRTGSLCTGTSRRLNLIGQAPAP
jgi:hypothetical protein